MKKERITECSVFGLKTALKTKGTRFGYRFIKQGETAPYFKLSKKETKKMLENFPNDFTWFTVTKYQRDGLEVFIIHI